MILLPLFQGGETMTKYTVVQSYASDTFGSRMRGDVFETTNEQEVQELMANNFVVEGEVDLSKQDQAQMDANAQAFHNASQQAQQQAQQTSNFDYAQVQAEAQQLAQQNGNMKSAHAEMQPKGRANAKQVAPQEMNDNK